MRVRSSGSTSGQAAFRLLRRRALFLWIDPRFAALSRALAAAAIISPAVSPPFAITSRAVRTAVRAAERPIVRMEVRRCVWRMRLRAERLRFFAGIKCERYPMPQYQRVADVDRAGLRDHDRHPRRQPRTRLAAAIRDRGAFRGDA